MIGVARAGEGPGSSWDSKTRTEQQLPVAAGPRLPGKRGCGSFRCVPEPRLGAVCPSPCALTCAVSAPEPAATAFLNLPPSVGPQVLGVRPSSLLLRGCGHPVHVEPRGAGAEGTGLPSPQGPRRSACRVFACTRHPRTPAGVRGPIPKAPCPVRRFFHWRL